LRVLFGLFPGMAQLKAKPSRWIGMFLFEPPAGDFFLADYETSDV
jgi:hypothetical protein